MQKSMSVPRIRAVLPAECLGCLTGRFTIVTVLAMKQRYVRCCVCSFLLLHFQLLSKPIFFRQNSERRSFKLRDIRKLSRDGTGSPSKISPPSTPSSPDDTFFSLGDPQNGKRRRKIPKVNLGLSLFLLGFFHARMYETVFSLVFSVVSLQYVCCPRSWLNLCLISFLPEGRGSPIFLQVLKKLFFCLRYHDCQE